MELIPVIYHDDPSMIIGTAVHIDETKNINRIITAASGIGLTAPKLDADYLEEYEMEYDENERYVLLYSLTNGRYPDLIWVPVSEGSIDYDF